VDFLSCYVNRSVLARDVLQDNLVIATLPGARAFPFTPSTPAVHETLGIFPVATSHLDRSNVCKEPFRAPAKHALLDVDESRERNDSEQESRGGNAKPLAPPTWRGHICLDTERRVSG
jgi:hypothetical protein